MIEEQERVGTQSAETTIEPTPADSAPGPSARSADAEPPDPPPEASAPVSATPAPADTAVEKSASAPQGGRQQRSRAASLYRAMRSRRPVAGRVEGVIKGGYEVRLGKVRGFCPHSQIDLHRVDTPEIHVGKSLMFRVTQVRRGGEDVVLSRRAVLEDERREEAAAVRATLLEGAVMRGRVAGLAEFGVFVDLGAGVMGLVHVSEVSHSRVARVEDAVREGDAVQVRILKIHDGGKKISLSIRQAMEDPWAEIDRRFVPGTVYPGTVQRLTGFGAFVELAPGVEALAPAGEFAPSAKSWKDDLEVGRTCDWLVLSVDRRQRRITVVPPVEGYDASAATALQVGASIRGRVQRIEDFGVFVWLAPGHVGLMPNALSGVPRGTDMQRRFPVGDPVEVEIREITGDGRRIRLAQKGAMAKPERPPQREPRRVEPPPPPRRPEPAREASSFGTSLAEKLRAALEQRADRG